MGALPRNYLLCCLLFCILACAPQKSPDLLSLSRISPAALEPESELEIEGNGFPENRRGTLTLEGVAHTPARAPRQVKWELPLISESRTKVTLRPDARLLSDLTEGAFHLTFRGKAQLSFPPLVSGRPPLRGQKENVVLDFFVPGLSAPTDPSTFSNYLGLELSPELVVQEVQVDSRASSLGLQAGDRIHSLDGVRLDSPRDFLPQSGARTSVLEISRGASDEVALIQVERASFQLLELTVATRALAVLLGVVLSLLWVARPPRLLVWLFAEKSRARRGPIVWLSDVSPRGQAMAYPAFLVVVVGFHLLLQGWETGLLGAEFLGTLATGGLLLLLSAFALGGRRSTGVGFSLLGAISGALLRLLVLAPVIVASLAAAANAGTLSLSEIAGAQGFRPDQWALFESPFSFLLGATYLLALLPLAGRRAPLEGHRCAQGAGLLLARASEWTGHLILVGLWIALFAGGPFQGASFPLVEGITLSIKIALLACGLAWVRARTGHLRMGESWGLFGAVNLCVSLILAGLSCGAAWIGLSDTHAEFLGLSSAALAVSLMILLVISSQRSWAHMGRRIDPWI
jgi:NADH:ubiquinone oxidoreductase subunit H